MKNSFEDLLKEIKAYEDQRMVEKADRRLAEAKDSDWIDFEEAMRLAGWEK